MTTTSGIGTGPRAVRAAAGVALLLGAALAGGCVERRPMTEAEKREVRAQVSTEAPSPEHPLEVDFEGKVKLVGYDVAPATIAPGGSATVTWYWKVERPLPRGWRLFTHVSDSPTGDVRLNLDGEGLVRRVLPPAEWKAGEYVADAQTFTLPADWNAPEAHFFVGLWNGPNRLGITAGPSDGADRARAAVVPVAGGAPAAAEPAVAAPPSVIVPRATGAVTLDGKLDEPAWSRAVETGRFVDTLSGEPAALAVEAKLLWDDEALYVAFEVDDTWLVSEHEEADDELWTDDVVEIMVDPAGDRRNYFEMQVSPTGLVFDTRYDSRREPRPYGHVSWDSDLRARLALDGTPNDGRADRGYVAEIAIPWAAFAAGEPPAARPDVGEVWRGNLYVMDREERGQRAAGWSPTRVGDFHVPARFAVLTFGDADGQVPTAAGAAPAAEAPPAGDAPASEATGVVGATGAAPSVLRLVPGEDPIVAPEFPAAALRDPSRPTPEELLRRQRELNRMAPTGQPVPLSGQSTP